MSKDPLSTRRVRAQPGLEYPEPRFSAFTYQFIRAIGRPFLRFAEGVNRVELHGAEHLVDAYARFNAGTARLMIAWRHGAAEDASVMAYALANALPRAARRLGRSLGGRAHAHFVYGWPVLLWGGPAVRWALPRLAGLVVMNRKADRRAIAAIRRCLIDGALPMALAPEGQVTYHQQRVGPIEPGTSRLLVGAADELARKGRTEQVLVVPVALRYRTPGSPEQTLRALVDRVISAGGLAAPSATSWDARLFELTEAIVVKLEAFYGRYYPSSLGEHAGQELRDRIIGLCEAALTVGEQRVGCSGRGDLLTRVFALRQRCWELIYRDELATNAASGLAPLERALLDRIADQAARCMHHMELADILEYVDPGYLTNNADPARSVEYALNLLDVLNRAAGGNISSRHKLTGKTAQLHVGAPLCVQEVCDGVAGSARARAEVLGERLRAALEQQSRAPRP